MLDGTITDSVEFLGSVVQKISPQFKARAQGNYADGGTTLDGDSVIIDESRSSVTGF